MSRAIAFIVATSALLTGQARATADLDSSFGDGGRVITDLSGRYDEARTLAIAADGRILTGGVTGTGFSQNFALARYNSDGVLDRTFGLGGIVTTDVSRGADVVWALAIQGDHRILAAGAADGDFAVARYDVNGGLDTQFGNGGTATTDFGGDDRANALVVQRDGQIVVAGVTDRDVALARYRADGTRDATFGTNGTVITDFSDSTDAAFALALQSNGMIVVAGATGRYPVAQFALTRYNTDGSLDEGFGVGGKATIGFGKDARARTLAIQANGQILTGGIVNNGSSVDGALVRLNADGTMDSSFGAGGKVSTDFGGRNFGSAVAIQADGKFVVAGADDFPPYYDFALARYKADGDRDDAFGSSGTVLTDFGGNSWINAVAVQSDGKIVAVGYVRSASGADFALVRYDGH